MMSAELIGLDMRAQSEKIAPHCCILAFWANSVHNYPGNIILGTILVLRARVCCFYFPAVSLRFRSCTPILLGMHSHHAILTTGR